MRKPLGYLHALLILSLMFFCPVSNAAVTWQVENGKLIGAKDVQVGTSTYDVAFVDGSCNSLFAGCDPATFVFKSFDGAHAASIALHDSVLVGIYDTDPALTAGCSHYLDCAIYTPYNTATRWGNEEAISSVIINFPGDRIDASNMYGMKFFWSDTTSEPRTVFAIWSVASNVPEPNMALMLCVGFLCLASWRHRAIFGHR